MRIHADPDPQPWKKKINLEGYRTNPMVSRLFRLMTTTKKFIMTAGAGRWNRIRLESVISKGGAGSKKDFGCPQHYRIQYKRSRKLIFKRSSLGGNVHRVYNGILEQIRYRQIILKHFRLPDIEYGTFYRYQYYQVLMKPNPRIPTYNLQVLGTYCRQKHESWDKNHHTSVADPGPLIPLSFSQVRTV